MGSMKYTDEGKLQNFSSTHSVLPLYGQYDNSPDPEQLILST